MKYHKEDLKKMEKILRENAEVYFKDKKIQLKRPDEVVKYLEGCLSNSIDKEIFGCIFMNNKNFVLSFEILFEGTIDCSVVYPREIMKRCLELNSNSILVCHNHPAGATEPSSSDHNLTVELKSACDALDIRLLDHIILGRPGESYSMKDNGDMRL